MHGTFQSALGQTSLLVEAIWAFPALMSSSTPSPANAILCMVSETLFISHCSAR